MALVAQLVTYATAAAFLVTSNQNERGTWCYEFSGAAIMDLSTKSCEGRVCPPCLLTKGATSLTLANCDDMLRSDEKSKGTILAEITVCNYGTLPLVVSECPLCTIHAVQAKSCVCFSLLGLPCPLTVVKWRVATFARRRKQVWGCGSGGWRAESVLA